MQELKMPANDPAAYAQMSPEDIVKSLESELQSVEQEAAAMGISPSEAGVDQLEGGAVEADAEQALTDTEETMPSGADAETALANVMASGVTEPSQVLDALRSMGFELVRSGTPPGDQVPEAAIEEAPMEEEEMPFREARRRAAEKAVGGTE